MGPMSSSGSYERDTGVTVTMREGRDVMTEAKVGVMPGKRTHEPRNTHDL